MLLISDRKATVAVLSFVVVICAYKVYVPAVVVFAAAAVVVVICVYKVYVPAVVVFAAAVVVESFAGRALICFCAACVRTGFSSP